VTVPAARLRRPAGGLAAACAAILAVVLAMVLAGCGAGAGSVSVGVGRPVPDIAQPAIGGAPVSLRALRGHWVVVNFFATWCEPCQQEYPQLVKFTAQQKGAVQLLGVVYEDRTADALRFHRAEGGTWPIVADPSAHISTRYQVSALPQSFVVDPNGTLAARIFGGVTVAKLDQAIAGAPARR
jgi:cytochrome c biogenesis protein CcmG/thiol:disulfide interchange protein DsbE